MATNWDNPKYWVKLSEELEKEIGTEKFNELREFLEYQLKEYLGIK